MKVPLVSIIIPTYNRVDLIERAICSALDQSYQHKEIIVVDDGSTDHTKEVLTGYIQNGQIRYIKKENGGCASARNKGISEANGSYLAFLDSDDAYHTDAIKNLLDILENKNADFAYSPVTEKYQNHKEIVNYPIARDDPENFATTHLTNTNVYIHACLFKRNIFEKLRMDESMKYNEDSDFLQRVAINFRAVYLDQPTVMHYHHDTNKSNNRVGIIKALMYSLKKIETDYPDFYEKQQKIADQRFIQLQASLLKQYILNKDYSSAKEMAKKANTNIFIQSAIFFKSKYPVLIGNLLRLS